MKYIEGQQPDTAPGRLLTGTDRFQFACHPGVSCFNRCCRNLNLYLYPYDVIRLKNNLGVTSDAFIDAYTDVILREGSYFPHVLLRMADNDEKTCPFLTEAGCQVYPDRPQTCRAFPVEHGLYFGDDGQRPQLVHYFRPPDFCRGQDIEQSWTIKSWEADQNATFYNHMTVAWAEVMALFSSDPWGDEGPGGQKGKMAFMAGYNVDAFRRFVLESSFLRRYKIKSDLRLKIRSDDVALLRLGMAWIKMFVFGMRTPEIKLK